MVDQHIEAAIHRMVDNLKQACGQRGLGNGGDEYRIVVEMILYKFFNDKFGYEAKRSFTDEGHRLAAAPLWDAEYDSFTETEIENLFDSLPAGTPLLRPHQTISHLYNRMLQGDFSTILDSTLEEIGRDNADIFSMRTVSKGSEAKSSLFKKVTTVLENEGERDEFAISLMKGFTGFNFEDTFSEKYDFFSSVFEYVIKDYNKDGGGKYAEYYTPRSIATIMARLLVGDAKDLRGVTCYDPSAGTGTLLMALAHQIGEERCSIFSQDISEKSSLMLRFNLVLNNLVGSMKNIVRGNTLTKPAHLASDGVSLRQFDFIVSNPPFKLDFSEDRETLAADTLRFWAGVPAVPKQDKDKMAIYLLFIQHLINSLDDKKGKGAIVIPTGFITSKSGIGKKVLEKIVTDHIVYGCVSMPSNVFATTGTNVSVLFFDKSRSHDKVVLIDASKLGEEYKDGKNQRTRLRDEEIELIVDTFINEKPVDDFSVCVSYDEIAKKGFSLSAGQYFDVKIEYTPITPEQFCKEMNEAYDDIFSMMTRSEELGRKILQNLDKLTAI